MRGQFMTRKHCSRLAICQVSYWEGMFNLHINQIFNHKIMERSRIYDEPISTIERLLENGRWVSNDDGIGGLLN